MENVIDRLGTTTRKILDSINDLHSQGRVVTRGLLMEHTGFNGGTIKDSVDVLIENGLIARPTRDVYQPANPFPCPRPISRTALPDGMSVLEIGDTVLHLSPRESRVMGQLFGADATSVAQAEIGGLFNALEAMVRKAKST